MAFKSFSKVPDARAFRSRRLPLFFGQLFWFENHDKFLECAREGIGRLVRVVLDHRTSRVLADIEGFTE